MLTLQCGLLHRCSTAVGCCLSASPLQVARLRAELARERIIHEKVKLFVCVRPFAPWHGALQVVHDDSAELCDFRHQLEELMQATKASQSSASAFEP
jgi:hypothetical protein